MRSTLFFLSLALMIQSCTYGRVTWGDDPVENVSISISNCDAVSWSAVTDSDGWYSIDGYDDPSQTVTAGLILILATLPNGYQRFEFAVQEYEPCPDDPSLFCDRHDVDFGFRPLSPWEWEVWRDALERHNSFANNDFFAFCAGT